MKSVLNEEIRIRLIKRINLLREDSKPKWGKMEIDQMIRHNILWNEMSLGRKPLKQTFPGFLFGKLVLRKFLKDESPLPKNVSTLPFLIIKDHTGNLESNKQKWIEQISEYGRSDDYTIIHPFFGKMNKDQIGKLAYKHTDHHLRQFNV